MDAKTRFEENTSLVYHLLHKYFPRLVHNEDVEQICMIGLWKACLVFDESKGFAFSTLASRCILNDVRMYLRSQNKINKLPVLYMGNHHDSEDISADDYLDYLMVDKEDKYSCLEILESIHHVLNRYNDRDRNVIQYYLCGLGQVEIGKRVGSSQAYVSRKISKFKKDMEVELYGNLQSN